MDSWLTQLARKTEQAEAGTETSARVVAIFYKTLVAEGVPENVAAVLTSQYIHAVVGKMRTQAQGGDNV